MDFRNCPRCDKLFRYIGRKVCPACVQIEEKEFDQVRIYVRDNKGQSIIEVSEATGVSVEKIIYYLRDGRLLANGMDVSGVLSCESCGAPIEEGRLCATCRLNLANQFERTVGRAQPQKEPKQTASSGREKMYTAQKKK